MCLLCYISINISIESNDNFIYEDGLGVFFNGNSIKLMALHVDDGGTFEVFMSF